MVLCATECIEVVNGRLISAPTVGLWVCKLDCDNCYVLGRSRPSPTVGCCI